MEAQWYRQQGHEVSWGKAIGKFNKVITRPEGLPFLSLPAPDRVWTKAKTYMSGNYKYVGTHILAANGCWHGQCTFCVENGSKYEVRMVEDVVDEIDECKSLGFEEVFDDSGTFPRDIWLKRFCAKMVLRPYKIVLGCNMRIVDTDYELMKWAGFRMLLFGVESANQETLDRIHKGLKFNSIVPILKKASQAGLQPHITVMFGYPWETDEDALRTLKFVHRMLRSGYAYTAQASLYSPEGNESQHHYVKELYDIKYDLRFIMRKISQIRSLADIKYYLRNFHAS